MPKSSPAWPPSGVLPPAPLMPNPRASKAGPTTNTTPADSKPHIWRTDKPSRRSRRVRRLDVLTRCRCAPSGQKTRWTSAHWSKWIAAVHAPFISSVLARVGFKLTGPAIWRGGYNSGKANSVNISYLDTECGINRVALRSTLTPGAITLAATRPGLAPATVTVEAHAVAISNGLLP